MKRVAAFAVLAAFCVTSSASALILTGGPTYTLPGGGSCTTSGITSTNTSPGGTWLCTGVNLSAHTNVYFGIKNDVITNGNTMTGVAPASGGPEVFRFFGSTASTIIYTSSTSVADQINGTQTADNQLTLNLTAGSATVASTGGTPGDNGNGDVAELFKLTGSGTVSFSIRADTQASTPFFALDYAALPTFDNSHSNVTTGGDVSQVDLAFYYSDCGDGVVDSPEQCDDGPANGTAGSCCSTTCTFKLSGTACTDDGNVCTTDTCNGSSDICQHPAGNAGTVCRGSAGQCDVAETCTGTSTLCPANAFASSSTHCTGAAQGGACDDDASDHCSGTANTCIDAFQPSTTVCRPVAGVCDVAENCTGSSSDCPPDGFEPASTVCRSSQGECDPAENCTGTSADCPADFISPATTPCTDDGNPCTLDQCDGTSPLCQHPAGNAGALCRSAAGDCDIAEYCDGSSTSCPPDAVQPSTTVCRTAAGECDVAENCDGVDVTCPPDGKVAAGTACTPDSNPCTLDQCDGSSNDCTHPAGNAGTVCRTSAGVCDVAETCTGTDINCPADSFEPATVVCRSSQGACDPQENCTGTGPDCSADVISPSGTVCRTAAGECDVAETCDGSSVTCPQDAVQPVGTSCSSDGNPCTLDQCDGSSVDCTHPAGNAGTVCRSAAGVCDVDETCDGSSTTCPTDVFQPASTVCRSAASECDVAENCTGTSADCPADQLKADGTPCNGTNNNSCMNACQAGTCTPEVIPNCCGNGVLDPGEQCDDGNVSNSDICPSAPGATGNCRYDTSHSLIRGTKKKPTADKYSCQVEWYVADPTGVTNPLDKRGLPNQLQVCHDQDPTCDSNLTDVGRCRFQIVACLNNVDPNIVCTPHGISQLSVLLPSKAISNTPVIGPLQLANIGRVANALKQLLDPNNPGAGYNTAPPLAANQQGFCTAPIDIDVIAATTPSEFAKALQTLRTKSVDANFPTVKHFLSKLKLRCLPHT